jgi:release factor glutamine methyltransferase
MAVNSIGAQLAAAQLPGDSAALDAQILLAELLQVSRTYLATWPERELTPVQVAHYQRWLARRRSGEPVAYIVGHQGFWSLQLACAPSTLIPRPETELVVEQALELALEPTAAVLDLGCGTGAIALALASERQRWQIVAVERDAAAVQLAERNRRHCATGCVQVVQSDWFAALGERRFDLIVSNPPYIEAGDNHLAEGDVAFEPRSALVAGADGLADLRHIIRCAPQHLQRGGWLLVEHGYNQAAAVAGLFEAAGFAAVSGRRDLNGVPRTTIGRWQ